MQNSPSPQPRRRLPDLPPDWMHVHGVIHADPDEWGRRAALFVAAYRMARGEAPTFSELFDEITPELRICRYGSERTSSERQQVRWSFMSDVAFTFMLRGWIQYGSTPRSLQTSRKAHEIQRSDIRTYSAQFVTRRHWAVNVRKFSRQIRDLRRLVSLGSLTVQAAEFLRMCVLGGQNILVSGATQSGKTTMLGALLAAARPIERIVTVEETFELNLSAMPDVVAMQCRQPSLEGTGEISLRRLIKEALRMRPDRLIVGEVREGEALDLLIALNSGLPGMCSLHANSAREALSKLCTLPLLAGRNIDASFVVPTVASSIDIVVHCELARNGQRRVAEILALSGQVTSGVIEASVIFSTGRDGLSATGSHPTKTTKFRAAGLDPVAILAGGAR